MSFRPVSLQISGKICNRTEFRGQIDRAHSLYQKAWEAAQDDYEACIAAHYVARHQNDPQERLHWNQVALDKAKAVADQRVDEFCPSLYLNTGKSYELLGKHAEAKRYYDLAAEFGVIHQDEQSAVSGQEKLWETIKEHPKTLMSTSPDFQRKFKRNWKS